MRRLDALHFFCEEPAPHSGLEYILQRFFSLMHFRNEFVFTEIFLKRGGKDSFRLCGRGLRVSVLWSSHGTMLQRVYLPIDELNQICNVFHVQK